MPIDIHRTILKGSDIEDRLLLLPPHQWRSDTPHIAASREDFRRLIGQLPVEQRIEQTFLRHQCCILIDVRRKSVLIAIVGVVGGDAAPPPPVVAMHLVDARIVHRLYQSLGTRQLLCSLFG